MANRIPPGRGVPAGDATVIRSPGGGAQHVLPRGLILGHTYAIEEFLGRVPLGDMYRVKHVELGTTHVVKLIQPALTGDSKTVSMLVDEVRKLTRVRHDAIVNYEGLFRDERGLRYLVLEYAPGPSLAMVLAERRLEPDEVLRLRDRLAEGLAAVHAHGIIHRDLSPENIVVPDREVGRAKLTGFGFAKTAEAGDATMIGLNLMARHAFASPEQLGLFDGRVDLRSDLYSLGLVLAAAAIGFGRTLDMGATPVAALAARQKVPDLRQIPEPLRPVIAPLLEPRKEDRPASAAAVAGAVAPPRTPASVGASVAASVTDKRQSTNRSRAGWLLAGGALLIMLAAGTAFLMHSRVGPVFAPAPDELRGQLSAATTGYACASIVYSLLPDRTVRLTGHVASADDLARLRRDIGAIAGIKHSAIDVELMGRPHCEIAALLAPFAEPAARSGLNVTFAGKPAESYIGDRPSLDVRAPDFDSYLYIDYFDSGGQVLHLYPNQRDRFNLKPWRNRFVLFKSPFWTVCGNVGRQLLTTVATAKPIPARPAADVEDARDYAASLANAIKQMPAGKATASLLFFDLREAPPWVNRELACPSG